MNENLPLVSIAIPVYNQEISYFKEALHSALNQTYPHIEVVVSDNHSTNGVVEFLAEFTHPRLRVTKPDTFLSMLNNFSFAGDQVSGEFFTFLSSDDWLYPDFIEFAVLPMLQNERVILSYGEVESVDFRDLTSVRYYMNERETGYRTARESFNELLNARMFAWVPGGLMRTAAYNKIKHIDPRLNYINDTYLLFKLHETGDVFYTKKPAAKFRLWTEKDGKVGTNRLLDTVDDFALISDTIERSEALMKLADSPLVVKQWRAYQAKRLDIEFLVRFAVSEISREVYAKGLRRIETTLHGGDLVHRAAKWTSNRPQAFLMRPILEGMYVVYLKIQRVFKRVVFLR
ncbi:MAG: glycosyltransferase [Bacteroidetes bacterium]|nr:glycosyltransferase [Fibrella sp.]